MEPEASKLDDALLGKVNDVVLSLDALGLTRQIAADMRRYTREPNSTGVR
jgi:hypothetical protein